MKIRPIQNQVLLELDPETAPSETIIAPSEDLHDFPDTGTVVAKGPRCKHVSVGQRLLFNKHAPGQHRLDIAGKAYMFIRETELYSSDQPTIIGVLEHE